MDTSHDDSTAKIVLALVSSSLLITLPNYIFGQFGNINKPAIALESLIVVCAFILSICGLTGRIHRSKYWFILIFSALSSVVLLLLPFGFFSGFRPLYVLPWIMVILASFFFARSGLLSSRIRLRRYLGASGLVIAMTVSMMAVVVLRYGFQTTDETIINLYSAKLFLSGVNPYGSGALSGAFSFYHMPLYLVTPTTSGGYVESLTYPALAFIISIPSALTGLNPTVFILPFYLIPVVMILHIFRSGKLRRYAIVSSLAILFNIQYFLLAGYGDNDIIWVILLMLTAYFIRFPVRSGIFFGLALSVKIIPVLSLPFLLYFVFREYGVRKALYLLSAIILTFFTVNSYFILKTPVMFYRSMLSALGSHLIGIGFGPSQLSFTGILPLRSSFFVYLMIASFLLLVSTYILYYHRLRYAIFLLPVIISLFNYRVLVQYIMFWPMITIFLLPHIVSNSVEDSEERKLRVRSNPHIFNNRYARLASVLFIASLLILAGSLYSHSFRQDNGLKITGVTAVIDNNSTTVDSVVVNISSDFSSNSQLYFRFIANGAAGNVNGLLWSETGTYTIMNGNASLSIHPLTPQDQLHAGFGYMLIAYNSNIVSSRLIRVPV